MARNLRSFRKVDNSPGPMTAAERRQLKLRQACYRLTKSPLWDDILLISEEYVRVNTMPPPTAAGLLCGYFVSNIIKDGLGQFIDFIEQEAALAPQSEEEKE